MVLTDDWEKIPGPKAPIRGEIDVTLIASKYALVECPNCHAAIRNSPEAKAAHQFWHTHYRTRMTAEEFASHPGSSPGPHDPA